MQLYLSKGQAGAGRSALHAGRLPRVAVAAGETRTIAFSPLPDRLAVIDDAGNAAVQPGAYKLIAGGGSPGLRSAALGARRRWKPRS